ncbi:Transcription factor DP [Klebsormidium nitens]|uniref:Transcription factor DP n=1 Tax=Klebsormidium nitens TaxID=105231 RepID=A0A1Y1HJS8_KLENI|nr:Transcription factor DP [Klebsormidium nitens]|eukprot:GAQ78804.1 Transcription factor DP [Klebsormidium nitens]
MESPAKRSNPPQPRSGGPNGGPPSGGGMLQDLQREFYEQGLEGVAAGFGLIKEDPGSARKRPSGNRPVIHYMGNPQNAPPGSIPMFGPPPDAAYAQYPPREYGSPVKQDGRLPLPPGGVRVAPSPAPRMSFREIVSRDQQQGADAADRRGARRGGSRGGDKASKGLRHFSLKVCEKVEEKGRTTYNEVADELVREIAEAGAMNSPSDQSYDEKNIRRRVYDALNVLMALDIIVKDKKEIHWRGLPSAAVADIGMLKDEKSRVEEQMAKKQRYLGSLHQQFGSYENLVMQNQRLHGQGEGPGEGIAFPFVLIKTKPQATVEVEISEDMQLVHFDFNDTPYKMLDHDAILELMGLVNRPSDGAAEADEPQELAAAPPAGPSAGDRANGTAVPHLESGAPSPRAPQQEQVRLPPPNPAQSYQPVRQEAAPPNGIRKGARGGGRGQGRRLLPEGVAAPQNGR